MWSNRNSHSLLVGMKNGTNTLEESLIIFPKTKHILAINPAIILIGMCPKELKTYVHTHTKTAYECL